jgi:hypothetical protein
VLQHLLHNEKEVVRSGSKLEIPQAKNGRALPYPPQLTSELTTSHRHQRLLHISPYPGIYIQKRLLDATIISYMRILTATTTPGKTRISQQRVNPYPQKSLTRHRKSGHLEMAGVEIRTTSRSTRQSAVQAIWNNHRPWATRGPAAIVPIQSAS